MPLVCSISSTRINCGAVKLQSSKAKTVVLKEKRMQILKKTHTEERKAAIDQEDFLQNTYTAEDLTIHNVWGRSVGGFKTYVWIIMGSAVAMALLAGSIFMSKLRVRIQGLPRMKEENKKSSYEDLAMKQIMDDPFQLRGHTTPEPITKPPAFTEDVRLLEIQRINREK